MRQEEARGGGISNAVREAASPRRIWDQRAGSVDWSYSLCGRLAVQRVEASIAHRVEIVLPFP